MNLLWAKEARNKKSILYDSIYVYIYMCKQTKKMAKQMYFVRGQDGSQVLWTWW